MRMMRQTSPCRAALLARRSLLRRSVSHGDQTATSRSAAAAAVPGPGPQELMQKVSQDLLRDLDANRAVYTKDPQKLRALVDKYLLPHFDVDYAARLVLGQHWRTATEAQTQALHRCVLSVADAQLRRCDRRVHAPID